MRRVIGSMIVLGWLTAGNAAVPDAQSERRTGADGFGRDPLADEVVREFSGRASTQTLAFSVQGDWELRWHTEGNEQFPYLSHFRADLYDAKTHEFIGMVAQESGSSSGRERVGDGGRFYLKVRARNVNWSIEVVDVEEPWAQVGLVPKDAEISTLSLITNSDQIETAALP